MSTAPAACSSGGESPTPPSLKGGGLGVSRSVGTLYFCFPSNSENGDVGHQDLCGLGSHSETEAHVTEEIEQQLRGLLESILPSDQRCQFIAVNVPGACQLLPRGCQQYIPPWALPSLAVPILAHLALSLKAFFSQGSSSTPRTQK